MIWLLGVRNFARRERLHGAMKSMGNVRGAFVAHISDGKLCLLDPKLLGGWVQWGWLRWVTRYVLKKVDR